LQKTYAVQKQTALKLCKLFGVSPNSQFSTIYNIKLKQEIVLFIEREKQYIKKNRKKKIKKHIKKHISLNTYKGFRFKLGLPVRGQRTHTNACTSKKNIIK
jgi:small subunit ribosomal protein S13